MARSTYIYIARDPDGRIMYAGTVKWELVGYLKSPALDANDRLYYTVTRHNDGYENPGGTLIPMADLLA